MPSELARLWKTYPNSDSFQNMGGGPARDSALESDEEEAWEVIGTAESVAAAILDDENSAGGSQEENEQGEAEGAAENEEVEAEENAEEDEDEESEEEADDLADDLAEFVAQAQGISNAAALKLGPVFDPSVRKSFLQVAIFITALLLARVALPSAPSSSSSSTSSSAARLAAEWQLAEERQPVIQEFSGAAPPPQPQAAAAAAAAGTDPHVPTTTANGKFLGRPPVAVEVNTVHAHPEYYGESGSAEKLLKGQYSSSSGVSAAADDSMAWKKVVEDVEGDRAGERENDSEQKDEDGEDEDNEESGCSLSGCATCACKKLANSRRALVKKIQNTYEEIRTTLTIPMSNETVKYLKTAALSSTLGAVGLTVGVPYVPGFTDNLIVGAVGALAPAFISAGGPANTLHFEEGMVIPSGESFTIMPGDVISFGTSDPPDPARWDSEIFPETSGQSESNFWEKFSKSFESPSTDPTFEPTAQFPTISPAPTTFPTFVLTKVPTKVPTLSPVADSLSKKWKKLDLKERSGSLKDWEPLKETVTREVKKWRKMAEPFDDPFWRFVNISRKHFSM